MFVWVGVYKVGSTYPTHATTTPGHTGGRGMGGPRLARADNMYMI